MDFRMLLLLFVLSSALVQSVEFGEEDVPTTTSPSTGDFSAMTPDSVRNFLNNPSVYPAVYNNPTFKPEYAAFIPKNQLSKAPPGKLDVGKVPPENRGELTKDQLLFKDSSGKPAFERIDLNDVNPAVRSQVIKESTNLPEGNVQIETGDTPIKATQTKNGVQLDGTVKEVKQGNAQLTGAEDPLITDQGTFTPHVDHITSGDVQAGAVDDVALTDNGLSFRTEPAVSPGQGGVSGPSTSSPKPLFTIGNLKAFVQNVSEPTRVNITTNKDGTYSVDVQNIVTQYDDLEFQEFILGDHSSYDVDPREGFYHATLDSPGRYIYQFKELQKYKIGGIYQKNKTFGQSFSIYRPSRTGPYNVQLQKPTHIHIWDGVSGYVSGNQIILPGIVTYMRYGFSIASEESVNGIDLVDIRHTDNAYHPIVESLHAGNTLKVNLDASRLNADIELESTQISVGTFIAHFENMMVYDSAQGNASSHFGRWEHVNTPAVINTFMTNTYEGTFKREGDRIVHVAKTANTTFYGHEDVRMLHESLMAYDNLFLCNRLDKKMPTIPTGTIFNVNDRFSVLAGQRPWKYWWVE